MASMATFVTNRKKSPDGCITNGASKGVVGTAAAVVCVGWLVTVRAFGKDSDAASLHPLGRYTEYFP